MLIHTFNLFSTVADNLYFNGTALVRWDLMRNPIAASRESIKFRFKTTVANGVLMYSRGTQGDYIALQLRDNRMLLNIDLGMLNILYIYILYFLYRQIIVQ